ncbi:RNase adapter RapZ [Sneathiella chungangensis]|uniref:RNase adapter RapZ n=1 Tax=Sneathiella chungangensis TaxID=1418234 RepID=A0A845MNX9_9PROT|nr:RNase adapter RapZ [Sneathiella chungangensis]MZR24004.1 RNase adapter RapZ [Sneathiella chungangensis]
MDPDNRSPNQVVIVSGLSGAGKSTALRQFEDMGWEVADNLPLSLLTRMVDEAGEGGGANLAIGIDLRTRGFSTEQVLAVIDELREKGNDPVRLLFMDCDEAVLQRRFTETRRRHPLAADRPVGDGIRQEKQRLAGLKDAASLRIDSTNLSLPELKRILTGHFSLQRSSRLSVTVMSFSYINGIPREADLMFDVRFLQNPFYDNRLRPMTGQDSDVADFIARDPAFTDFMDQVEKLILLLLPRYVEEGKSYLTIAFGCTGGRHRSVCVAEKIHDLVVKSGYFANLVHRDLSDARTT